MNKSTSKRISRLAWSFTLGLWESEKVCCADGKSIWKPAASRRECRATSRGWKLKWSKVKNQKINRRLVKNAFTFSPRKGCKLEFYSNETTSILNAVHVASLPQISRSHNWNLQIFLLWISFYLEQGNVSKTPVTESFLFPGKDFPKNFAQIALTHQKQSRRSSWWSSL